MDDRNQMQNNVPMNEVDQLAELIRKQSKQLRYSRIACIASVVMAAILLVTCVLIVPRVISTIHQFNTLMEQANTVIENANTTLGNFDEMSSEITSAAYAINGLVDDNSEVLSESMNKMNSIDFEGLNKAIADLEAVVEPMANFFGKFR